MKAFFDALRWLILVPLGLIWFVFTFIWGGYEFTALVAACLMGLVLFYNCTALLLPRFPGLLLLRRCFTGVLCAGLLVLGITEALIIRASFGDPDSGCDYILVLGAKVRADGPSLTLRNRIDAAYDYLSTHPDAVAVVTGGQGPDESVSEAQCMYDHLVAMGIEPERIWMEAAATSTWENLQFSLDLIQEKTGTRPEKIGLISSEYHMFRAKLFAAKCSVEAVGIPAHTTNFMQMVNHFMREVAGVWHYILLGGQYRD